MLGPVVGVIWGRIGSKIDLFLEGLWEVLRKTLEKVLAGLLGRSMFPIPCKNISNHKFLFFFARIFFGFGAQLT